AGLESEAFTRSLGALRAARLVRIAGARDHGSDVAGDRTGRGFASLVEPYHDRVRETIASRLPAERCREIHRAIATSLEADSASIELLAYHLAKAGERTRAGALAEAAARRALDALAFDRAAEWLRITL